MVFLRRRIRRKEIFTKSWTIFKTYVSLITLSFILGGGHGGDGGGHQLVGAISDFTGINLTLSKNIQLGSLGGFKSNPQIYYNGAVAAEHPQCSEIGVHMIRLGGSAVDAAIAGLICVGVINNFSAGIGGYKNFLMSGRLHKWDIYFRGGFMLVRDYDGQYNTIDFREEAPSTAHRDMFNKNVTMATDSTRGAAIPGEMKGFAEAHRKWGLLPWSTLFAPSIKLAREGFPVTPKLEEVISKFSNKLKKSKGMLETYFKDDGTPKKVGDLIFRNNLADTLEKISYEGAEAFYLGSIGRRLVDFIKSKEGGFTMDDLENYRAILRDPLIYHNPSSGYKFITVGPPCAGGALVIQILNVIEKLSLDRNITDLRVNQKIIETFKFAYVDRMKIGDPDFNDEMEGIIKKIIGDERASHITPRIHEDETFPPDYYLENELTSDGIDHGTTHLTAMDRKGMVVSVVSTVNLEWGCKYMDEETGIILNNEMDDFSIPNRNNSFGLPPSEANFIGAGKRPVSSGAPMILEKDGNVILTIGGAGGSRIITAVASVLLNILHFGMAPDQAVGYCRLHHQLFPNALMVENRCDKDLVIMLGPKHFGTSVNLIMRRVEDGGMIAVSDARKGGRAHGL